MIYYFSKSYDFSYISVKKIFQQNLFFIYRSAGGRVQKPGRGSPRGRRGARGGRGGKAKREPAPSAEDLDKELDNYLKAR